MSLINEVLKDLAKRSKLSLESEIVLSGLEPYISPDQIKKGRKQWLVLWIVVALLAATVSVQIQNSIKHPKKHLIVPLASNVDQTPIEVTNLPASAPVPVLTYPTQVKDILLNANKETAILRFVLSQDALYHISSDPQLHRLSIILENAQVVAKLPVIDFAGSALTDVVMKEANNGDLGIVLSLRPNAEIKRIELNQLGALPELQFEIVNHTETVTSPAITSQPAMTIVKPAAAPEAVISTIKKTTDDPTDIELRARVLVDEGKFSDALTILKKTTPTINQYPDYYALLAAIYQHEGSSTQAAQLYRQLLAIKPDQSKWWVGLGVALETIGRNGEALEAYTEAKNNKQNLTPELQTYLQDRIENL
jgi:tetratricopeptide (TPR) repeat protein